jgi:alcohol dehydrogenase
VREELRKFVTPEIITGRGERSYAGTYARNVGLTRALLVTDPGVLEAGWAGETQAALAEAGVESELFSELTPNPKTAEVEAGAARYREAGCDGVVAVGGGSPIDCAKGIGILATNDGPVRSCEGVDRIGRPIPPLICVPTTAGTGADVSQFAIITDEERRSKMAIVSKAVVPDVSLVDCETTTTMDAELTACTGMDALVHAFEALASNACSTLTTVLALDALPRVFDHLVAATEQPQNLDHRRPMMLASLQAGIAFSNASLGLVHAMAHPLGGYLDLPHGLCNALLLEHVVAYNFDSAAESYTRACERLGLEPSGEALCDAIRELRQRVGLDGKLSAHGVRNEHLPRLAELALTDPCVVTNPRRPNAADVIAIYEQTL